MKIRLIAASVSGIATLAASMATAGGVAPAPATEPIVQAVEPSQMFDWSGGYAGLQYNLLNSDVDSTIGLFEDDYEFGKNVDGQGFGIFGGYNWQTDAWVYGVDVEYNWVDADDDAAITITEVGTSLTSAEIEATGALRARAGYAVGRALFYGTLGLAYVDYEIRNVTGELAETEGSYNWGWTAGIGMEYAFTENWIGRIDYRYSDYDGESGSFFDDTSDYEIDLDTGELRLGVAYRF
ncbi:MAG: outer membrane protein [Roseicyclus sp.]